jgi:hypothetical protein
MAFAYYFVRLLFLLSFRPALNAALCCFHLGIRGFALGFSSIFGIFLIGFTPYASGSLWDAESKAFRFDWKTLKQFFSCFCRTFTLNIRLHPIEHLSRII